MSGEGLGGLGRGSSPRLGGRRPQAGSAVSRLLPGGRVRGASGGRRRCGQGPSAPSGVRVAGGDQAASGGVETQAPPAAQAGPEGTRGVREGGGGDRHLSEQIRWSLDALLSPGGLVWLRCRSRRGREESAQRRLVVSEPGS